MTDPDKTYRTALILWIAMISSMAMYLVITQVIPAQDAAPNKLLVEVLIGIAVMCVAASSPLRSRVPGIAGYVLAFALSEAAGLLGLVTHFVTGWPTAWVFFVFGAVGFLLNFPQREN